MSVRLVVRPEAEAELLDARDWYDKQRAGLGEDFVDDARDALSDVATRPLTFPKVHGEIRRTFLRRFPYGVFYRLNGDEIVVLAVLHGRRSPAQWKSRS